MRRALAGVSAVIGALLLGRMLLQHGPHDVTLALVAPANICSPSLSVVIWKGSDPVGRPENLVRTKGVSFPDGRVHDFYLPIRLTSGVYRVRAFYEMTTIGGTPPLDQVIDVSGSGTVVLRLGGDAGRCP